MKIPQQEFNRLVKKRMKERPSKALETIQEWLCGPHITKLQMKCVIVIRNQNKLNSSPFVSEQKMVEEIYSENLNVTPQHKKIYMGIIKNAVKRAPCVLRIIKRDGYIDYSTYSNYLVR